MRTSPDRCSSLPPAARRLWWLLGLGVALAFVPTQAMPAQLVVPRVIVTMPDTTEFNAAELALVRFERRRVTALAARDTTTLRTMYSSNFRGVNPFGDEVSRVQLMKGFAAMDTTVHYRVDELSVRLLDESHTTAVITGRLRTLRGVDQVALTRYAEIMQLRGGMWQVVASQVTPARR